MAEENTCVKDLMGGIDEWVAWRHDIHAHPELGFEEHRTAGIVTEKLQEWGIEVFRDYGATGVVGRLARGSTGRAIGLRADMDALPIQEMNQFEHRSTFPGKFHGCGHDGHTVMLLAAARHLALERAFDGTVYFIFQPAEEGLGGAYAMIRDGLFDDLDMQYVYALHNAPGIAAGDFVVSPGPLLAALEKFDITVQGRGCHGAMPHQGVDPIVIAGQLIQSLQTIVSRSLDPTAAGVVSVTKIQGGDAYNVIPQAVRLGGAIRYMESATGQLIRDRMRQLVASVPAASGGTGEIVFHDLGYPPLVNEAVSTELAKRAALALVGSGRVVDEHDPIMGSDDFAYMLQEKPGCYVLIGNGRDGKGGCAVHHPQYDFNDDIIATGAAFWVRLVEEYFNP